VAHEREHQAHIAVSLVPKTLERLNLQTELLGLLEVTTDTTPSEHRIVLLRFVLSTRHVPELICRCVQSPYPDRFAGECVQDHFDAIVEFSDELFFTIVADVPSGRLAETEDHVFNSKQANAVCPGYSSTCGSLGKGDIHFDGGRSDDRCCGSNGNSRSIILHRGNSTLKDDTLLTVNGYNVPLFEHMRGIPCSDNGRRTQFSGDDCRVAGHPAFISDDGTHLAHPGHHVGVGHLCNHDVTVIDAPEVFYRVHQDNMPGGNTR